MNISHHVRSVLFGSPRAAFYAGWSAFFAVVGSGTIFAAVDVNAPRAIDRRLDVQIIQVAQTNGSSPAPLFGTTVQQAAIFGSIDAIWAQAGIDVTFKFRLTPYLDNFTLTGGVTGSSVRPTGDLNTIVTSAAGKGGILDPDPKVINLFMVQIVPGFPQTSDNTSNGLAFVGGNGVTLWAGPNLPGFAGGQDVIASVLAHELGHNLGLNHIVEDFNLMQAGGSANDGERLNASQINTVRSSSLLTVIPEPGGLLLLGLGMATLGLHRGGRRVRATPALA